MEEQNVNTPVEQPVAQPVAPVAAPQKNSLLNVTSILMIIGGIIAIILAIVTVLGTVALLAAYGGESAFAGLMVLLVIATVLGVGSSVIELIAGLKGKKAAATNVGGKQCVSLGIIIVIISLISIILNIVTSNMTAQPINIGSTLINALISLVLPVLYIIGAKKVEG